VNTPPPTVTKPEYPKEHSETKREKGIQCFQVVFCQTRLETQLASLPCEGTGESGIDYSRERAYGYSALALIIFRILKLTQPQQKMYEAILFIVDVVVGLSRQNERWELMLML
jgi:hypothetical protein